MTLFSTVNRKKYILQQKDYHASRSKELDAELEAILAKHSAKVAEHRARGEELDAELASIEAAKGNDDEQTIEHRSNKRHN